jgi:hypothetical protein
MTAIAATLDRTSFLRRVLWVDASTCLAMGALLVLFSAPLSSLLGLPALLLAYAGAALFPVAVFMGWVAFRDELSVAGAWVAILGNAGWVAGSVLVLVVFSPTGLGYAFVIAQAVVVGFLAELEYMGLRRIAS